MIVGAFIFYVNFKFSYRVLMKGFASYLQVKNCLQVKFAS